MTLPAVRQPYDQIASQYDQLWDTPEATAENQQVMDRIAYSHGDVLDIACGTGLFLDHHPNCKTYLGVDPSPAMLSQLTAKHPDRDLICETFEASLSRICTKRFDLIISLFGSPSYIYPAALDCVHDLLRPKGKMLLMFYAPGYKPVTHQYLESPPVLMDHNFANYGRVSTFGNYVVVQK